MSLRSTTAPPPPPAPAAERPLGYQHSPDLPELLARLEVSLVFSTYQAGKLVSLGSQGGRLQVGSCELRQAMGVCRTASGLAVGGRDAIWQLPANREIAARLDPGAGHDLAFLARESFHTGAILGHDLGWGEGRLWVVNTLFNCLCTLESPWSFVPRWRPPFISSLAPGDRCHLNGLAMAENGSGPAWVTALAESDEPAGWRPHKRDGGCLIEVASGTVVARGLCMPHSPRLYRGQLYLLDSGRGRLLRCDPASGRLDTVACLPGFTRGLDCFAGHAFVGLSRIRETAVFGGLPIGEAPDALRCGIAVVELSSGRCVGSFWFREGIEEVFACVCLPGYRSPVLVGPPGAGDNDDASVWLVPGDAAAAGPSPPLPSA